MNASKLNVGSTPIVSGTVGRLLFQGTGNVLQQSSSLFWDGTNNRLGIGTSSPISPIHILSPIGQQSTITLRTLDNTTSGGYTGINCFDNLDNLAFSFAYGNSGSLLPNSAIIGTRTATGVMSFVTGPSATVRATLFSTGNFAINTTTDAGFRLDVNGTSRYSGIARFQNTSSNWLNIDGSSSGTNNCVISNRFNQIQIVTNTGGGSPHIALLPATGGNVGIGTDTPLFTLDVNGTARVQSKLTIGNSTASPYQLNVWGGATESYISLNNTNSGALNTDGFQIGLEANGTDVYFINRENGFIQFRTNGLDRFRVANTGNVAIGTTTDAGFRLDVNGTARVGSSSISYTSALLTLTSDQGSASFRIGGGSAVLCSSSISAVNLSANDFVQCVRVLVGGAARINATTTDWLSITNWSQSSLGSGNVSANLATFGTTYATINASAQVEIASTTKGFLPPRMTNAQRTAIVSPAVGLIVYCTDVTEGLWVYKSTGWTFIV